MKKISFLVVLVCLFSSCLPQCISYKLRRSVHIDGLSYYLIPETNHAELVGHMRDYKDTCSVDLPETVMYNNKEYKVVKVEGYAFCGHNITSITIPNSVTSIGDTAFRYCTALQAITISKDINILKAFRHCPMLTNIQYTDGIDSLTRIDKYTFLVAQFPVCVIPDNVVSIGYGAFTKSKNLHTITIPVSVKSIDAYVFYSCTSLSTIIYEGTVEQWLQITKDEKWNKGTNTIVVKCLDGDLIVNKS